MPIYDYACKTCNKLFDRLLSVSEAKSKIPCEVCGNDSEKVITGIGSYEIKGNNSASTPPKSKVKK